MSKQSDLVSVSQGSGGDPLYIDTINDRVGVGTTSPATKLDVSGDLKIATGMSITPSTSTLYAQDATLSNYATNNGVYLNGHNAGWLRLNADGTNRTSIDLYGPNSASSPEQIMFKANNAERMRIDNAGRVTMPYQPAFQVTNASNSSGTLLWQSQATNVGNHYNPATGAFTAPVTGLYIFSVTVGSSSTFGLDLRVNGSNFRRLENSNIGGFYWSTVSVVYKAIAGDAIDVTTFTGTVATNAPYGGFSGYLLG